MVNANLSLRKAACARCARPASGTLKDVDLDGWRNRPDGAREPGEALAVRGCYRPDRPGRWRIASEPRLGAARRLSHAFSKGARRRFPVHVRAPNLRPLAQRAEARADAQRPARRRISTTRIMRRAKAVRRRGLATSVRPGSSLAIGSGQESAMTAYSTEPSQA